MAIYFTKRPVTLQKADGTTTQVAAFSVVDVGNGPYAGNAAAQSARTGDLVRIPSAAELAAPVDKTS